MDKKVVLSGNLEFLGLGDILQLIGSNGSTGILRIISKYSPDPGLIYFSKGNIINAACTSPPLGGLDAAYALFGWVEGSFEFSEEAVGVKKEITTSRMEIILDGLRMVDDGVTKKVGAVSFDQGTDSPSTSRIPVLKGPLIDYMYVLDEETYEQGRKIVQENKHGSWIWSILEGTVDIIKDTPRGPLTIIRLGAGAFIGGITSFLYHENVRKATAQAATDVQLGVLDSQRLAEEYGSCSAEFRDVVLSLDRRRDEVLERAVETYLKKDHVKKFTKGKKPFMKQGRKEERLLRIERGDACIVRKTKIGYLPLANLTAGDFIGAVPFHDIGHEPFHAAVFTSEDFEANPLDPDRLQEEYEQISPTLRNLIEGIAMSIPITTRVAYDFQKKNAKKA